MVDPNALLVAPFFVLIGAVVLVHARSTRERYATADEVDAAGDERLEPGGESTVRGPVRVAEPASPGRTAPDITTDGDPPALWAWRVRRKGGTQGSDSHWRTVEGGLSVGEFDIDHGWDRVRVDAGALSAQLADVTDPFEAPTLHLGDSAAETYLGDLDPINRFLDERTGLTDDGGVVSDLEVSINVGGKTNWPDKYQATAVREGDELVVRGELVETDEIPLIVGTADVGDQRERLRSRLRLQRAVGGGLIALGAIVAAVGVI